MLQCSESKYIVCRGLPKVLVLDIKSSVIVHSCIGEPSLGTWEGFSFFAILNPINMWKAILKSIGRPFQMSRSRTLGNQIPLYIRSISYFSNWIKAYNRFSRCTSICWKKRVCLGRLSDDSARLEAFRFKVGAADHQEHWKSEARSTTGSSLRNR